MTDVLVPMVYLYDLMVTAYYDGCIKALDDINQDVSQESDEYLKDEAIQYATRRMEEIKKDVL